LSYFNRYGRVSRGVGEQLLPHILKSRR
jgi:hypothetical protein